MLKENENELETPDAAAPAKTPPVAIKGVTTTLDYVDFGTEEDVEAELKKSRKERRRLPENIESKALYRDILRIAWPSLAELFLASLVNMVDMMMVGQLDKGAISSVNLATQPKFLIMTMVMALNTGATAVIARARGSGQHERTNDILRQVLIIGTIIAVICSVIGTVGSRWMVTFMANNGLSDKVIDDGVKYLQIQMATFLFPALSFSITAALRGTGNSKPCMVYNIVANLVNIVLNWLLIYGNLGFPKLGVAGASLATVIGQTVGTIMAFGCIISGKYYLKLKLSLKTLFKFDKEVVFGIIKVGVPSMTEQLLMRVGLVIFSRTVSSLGVESVDAHAICMSIQSLSMMNGQAFAVSATTLAGQSLGKRRLDLAEHYGSRCRNLSLGVSMCLLLIFALFGRYLVMLYSKDSEVIRLGTYAMLFVAFLQPFQSSQFVIGGLLRGAGDTISTTIITLITVVGVRTLLGFLFINTLKLGLIGAWCAIAADQTLRSLLYLLRYNQGKWKTVKLL